MYNDPPQIQPKTTARSTRSGAIPVGRVLAVACLVPILAMVVLGASRFDSIPAVDVDPSPGALSSIGGEEEQVLFSFSPPPDTALASDNSANEQIAAPQMMRVAETRMMVVTAYCACPKCCGKNARGITASGKPVTYNGGRFVAADMQLPFGTKVRIPLYHGGQVVEVVDRGGAIKGDKIDVFFPSHELARKWGRQRLPVQILEPAEPAVASAAPESGR